MKTHHKHHDPSRRYRVGIRCASSLRRAAILLAAGLLSACVNLDDPVFRLPEAVEAPEGEGTHCLSGLAKDDDSMRIHFIDVGQGDAIWIETADDGDDGNGLMEGYNILIDTGERDNAQVLIDYLTRFGLTAGNRIDFLVITHAHADHYGGAEMIMDYYRVRNIMDPGFDDDSAWYYNAFLLRAQEELTESAGVLYRPLVGTLFAAEYSTSDIFGSEIQTTLLNSESQLRLGADRYNQINNTSIAFSLAYGGIDVLLMGDVESTMETEIVDQLPELRGNILKVGHHGSTTSTSSGFVSQIFDGILESRRFAVVQSGTRTYGGSTLPASQIVNLLLQYVSTSNYFTTNNGDTSSSSADGAGDDHIQAVIDGDGRVQMCYVD